MRTLVLGLGNILLRDEGVGVRVVEALVERYVLPTEVEVVDGGTAGMDLLNTLAGCDHLLICDAVRISGQPGSVVKLADAQVPALFQTRCSPHQLGLSDLLAVLSAQDGIADMCEDLAVLVTVRTTRIPDAFRDGLFEYLDKCLEAAYLCVDITREFDRMIESSFGGHEAEKILGMIDAVSALEWEADKKQYRLAQHLFQLEDRLSPVDVMLWFEIFKVIGNIANSAEKMTKRLRTFFKA